MRKEKDEIIAELQFKIDHMESAYESVLHVSIHVHMIGGSNIIVMCFYIQSANFTSKPRFEIVQL